MLVCSLLSLSLVWSGLVCSHQVTGELSANKLQFSFKISRKLVDTSLLPVQQPHSEDETESAGPVIDCGHKLDCTGKPNGWYPDPYSCLKYWNCDNDQATHYICPEGLMYDSVRVYCDFLWGFECGSRPPCNECIDSCF